MREGGGKSFGDVLQREEVENWKNKDLYEWAKSCLLIGRHWVGLCFCLKRKFFSCLDRKSVTLTIQAFLFQYQVCVCNRFVPQTVILY
jgi:hypothetical protein